MVIIKSLIMKVVSIVIQRPLNPAYTVVKDKFQSRTLNVSEKILWPGELLSCQCRLHVPEKPEVRNQKVPNQDCKADWILE
jgi:hypothetical protein